MLVATCRTVPPPAAFDADAAVTAAFTVFITDHVDNGATCIAPVDVVAVLFVPDADRVLSHVVPLNMPPSDHDPENVVGLANASAGVCPLPGIRVS